jgi:gliding motility-associated protein GldE
MEFSPGLIVDLVVILILLAASALISGAEVAFFSMTPSDIESVKSRKGRTPGRVLNLIGRPEDLLATLLVCNNLINIGIVILSTWFTGQLLNFTDHPVLTFILQVVVITFVILLICEVLPKVYSTRHALQVVFLMAMPLTILERVLRPFNRVLVGSGSILKRKMKDQADPLTMEELSEALNLTGDDLKEEEKILQGIVRFGNIEVKEIMKPRVDIHALDIGFPFRKVFETMVDLGYSRFPVYHEDLDDIRGVLYIKDLLQHVNKPDTFKWQTLLRQPFFIPENKRINDLLEEFRKNKMHLALVVDEYGGTSGLITLEDILEEIVGEIRDESDDEDYQYHKTDDGSFVFNGKTPINDVIRILDLKEDFFDDHKGGSDTLAGLILEIRGELPEKGEQIRIKELTFVIKNRDDRRIKEIQINLAQSSNDPAV